MEALRAEMEALRAKMETLRRETADIIAFTKLMEEETERMIIEYEYTAWLKERQHMMNSRPFCR